MTCPTCGVPFERLTGGRPRQYCQSCSPSEPRARNRAWHARNREAQNAARPHVEHPTRPCVTCGTVFTTKTSLAHYCSESCRQRLRRQHHYLSYAAYHRLRREVLAEFGGTCYLCGVQIDQSLNGRHPLSFTLDHVFPWSAGGRDVIENLRPAHMLCNVEKGDRLPYLWEQQATGIVQ